MKISPLATLRSVVRNSAEAYYLHLGGAQQGPYTIPQIDHLLNSGLIGDETLYWSEGLDQWQPVTTLVPLRKAPKRWVKPVIAIGLLLALAVPARIFGPVLVDGWQEANQHDFTPGAAYWRARDLVRTDLRARGALVEFDGFVPAEIKMGENVAEVELRGSVTNAMHATHPTQWNASMRFDPATEEWSGILRSAP